MKERSGDGALWSANRAWRREPPIVHRIPQLPLSSSESYLLPASQFKSTFFGLNFHITTLESLPFLDYGYFVPEHILFIWRHYWGMFISRPDPMNERTDERKNKRTIEQLNEWTNERTNDRINDRANGRTNKRTTVLLLLSSFRSSILLRGRSRLDSWPQ